MSGTASAETDIDAEPTEDAMTQSPVQRRRGGGKRTPLSCRPCRQHKLRCDRRVPCGTCIRYHREAQCLQNPAPTRRKRGVASAPQPEPRLSEQLDAHAIRSPLLGIYGNGSQEVIDSNPVTDSGVLPAGRHIGGQTTTSPAASQGFASIAKLIGLGTTMDGQAPASLPQILAEANRAEESLPSWWSFLDPSHAKRLWRQQLMSVLPSRPQCDLLTNYYLEHVNWIFQTIHVPSFRREYFNLWDTGPDQTDLIWLSLLFTVISVAALYIPVGAVELVGCPRGSIRHLARVWHIASQHALRAGEYDARPCLTQLQTFSVTQLYWYATNSIETMNSHLGQAVRNAQAINLDRDISPSSCLQEEMRHRLWWDLVDSDMFQTICLDRQPLIRLQSPGVPLPLNCDDDDMTETSVNPKLMDQPTCMSMNIHRARVFQILNCHFCANNGAGFGSYEDIQKLDAEILEVVAKLPWYFQLDDRGQPPRIAAPLHEILTWQNHILRTCVSTQRIRMYKPFLAARVEGAWDNVVKAAEGALVVYQTLRTDRAPTSRFKFLAQAYQIFSVAVTIAALLLIEGTLPIPDVLQKLRNMATDLKMLEVQGCPVPVATHGRQILLRMLTLYENRATDPKSPEDAQRLVPDISVILGGEHTTQAYMRRLASQVQTAIPGSALVITQHTPPMDDEGRDETDVPVIMNAEVIAEFSPQPLDDLTWGAGVLGDLDPALFLEDDRPFEILNWDMTGLLVDAQNKQNL